MRHHFENHDLVTAECGEFVDITGDVLDAVSRSEVRNGQVVVYSPHTTCAIVVNERESGFLDDFRRLLELLVPPPSATTSYAHDDLSVRTENLEHETEELPNGHAHCRAALLSSTSQTIPIVDGRIMLGRWQKVFFCELDRSRPRKVFLQVTGE